MGGVKKYFRREFTKNNVFLDHDSAADFYLSCWQMNRSALPLLLLRTIIFLGCISIMIASIVLSADMFNLSYWLIFMTHWGLVLNTAASGFALVVSIRAFQGPIDASLELPWYVKAYWALFNIAVPIAFFITIFYWSLLTEYGDVYAMNEVLDVFIHAINSVLMLALVLIARHPTRLLHFYWSLIVGIIYLIFTVIFYVSGAQSPFGTSYVYPMLDWDEPGQTIGLVFASAFGFIILHVVIAAICVGRDKLTQRYRDTNTLTISSNGRYN